MDRVRQAGTPTVDALVGEIELLFQDDVKGVTVLSSIHKSKGREWNKVYWLQVSGGRQPEKDWEVKAEICLNYVAGTRAKDELILVKM